MRGRYKRRSKLTKLLYVLVALFLVSVWNYYRNNAGIFYTHAGFAAFVVFGCGLTVRHARRNKRKRVPSFARSAIYTKSRIGQSETLRRFRAELMKRGIMGDGDKKIEARLMNRRKLINRE